MAMWVDSDDSTGCDDGGSGFGDGLVIDCDLCEMQGTDVCGDCVVSFLCRNESSAVVIDLASARALRALSAGGLVPELRHRVAESVVPT